MQLNTPVTTQPTAAAAATKVTTTVGDPSQRHRRRHTNVDGAVRLRAIRPSISPVSITALNPTTTSSSSTPTLAPVIIVPPPTPPVVLHLGSSGSPVLAQMIHSAIEQQAEQPPSLNIFGQAMETELQKAFKPQLSPEPDSPPLIDVVEPFQPLDPADAPKGGSTVGPGMVGGWQSQYLLAVRGRRGDRGVERRPGPAGVARPCWREQEGAWERPRSGNSQPSSESPPSPLADSTWRCANRRGSRLAGCPAVRRRTSRPAAGPASADVRDESDEVKENGFRFPQSRGGSKPVCISCKAVSARPWYGRPEGKAGQGGPARPGSRENVRN